MRYCLSNVEFDEPIYIDACQRANHLVTIKYHLCKIIALYFEYACAGACIWEGACQVKKRLRSDTEDAKSVNSRFVNHTPIVCYRSAV
jgi:hypothetical protein